MDNIFGLPMNWILIVLMAIMGACLLTVALIGIFNRIVFKMALRNPARRRAQTALIVAGLMLATLIISSALTTGDTLDYSLKRSAYESLNRVDITIAFAGDVGGEGNLSVTSQPVPETLTGDLASQFSDDPGFESFMPVLTAEVPVTNQATGLSEPVAILTGLDWDSGDRIGGVQDAGGGSIDLQSIPAGGAIISETLAKKTGVAPGDTVTIRYDNQPHDITVVAIGEDSILTGQAIGSQVDAANNGLAMALDDVQAITGLEGQARFIAVTLPGGIEGSVAHSAAAEEQLSSALEGQPYGVNPVKRDLVEGAERSGNQFMSFFMVLGLFAIAAGILLIFLIFMMLASERRSEMGMARAVGMSQRQLVQQFIVEGSLYDLGAALVGAAAGVLFSVIMVGLLDDFIGGVVDIEPRWTARSLVVAYSLGVTVTFVTIIFASVRAARLNIVSAIRDLPEPSGRGDARPRWRWWKKLPRFGPQLGNSPVHWVSLIWVPLEIVPNLVLYPVRLAVWLTRLLAYYIGWGSLLTPVGLLLMLFGWSRAGETFSLAPYSVGLSLFGFGLMLLLAQWLPRRIVYTVISAAMLLWWLAPEDTALGRVASIFTPGDLEGDFEMFFISGMMMITYTTLLVIWNAEVIVWLAALFGKLFAHWVPAVKLAVAYPLASKLRTGLTLAMFSLVVFSLVMMATLNANFVELFASDGATAGWSVQIRTGSANPIDNLEESLAGNGVDTTEFEATGRVAVIAAESSQIKQGDQGDWKRYQLNGVDQDFAQNTEMPLKIRAAGYESDDAVWAAIANDPSVAVIDPFATESDGGPFGSDPDLFQLTGVDLEGDVMDPVTVTIADPGGEESRTIEIIGIIDDAISSADGLYLQDEALLDLYGGADFQEMYVRLEDGSLEHAQDVARQIESTLVGYGVQAESVEEQVQEQAEASSGFLNLIQGFMGLGLFVGIAALGVISFRAVVERRQQIGMLRAIGFQKGMVAMSFLIESLVIAGLGILAGVTLGLTLAYNLLNTGELQPGAEFSGFIVPWVRLGIMVAVTLGAAAVLTLIPSRSAASVPVAEALQYE